MMVTRLQRPHKYELPDLDASGNVDSFQRSASAIRNNPTNDMAQVKSVRSYLKKK
jgi:hypothetical protein